MSKRPKKLRNLKYLSQLMDSAFHGPFGLRIGLDGLIGLIPLLGDNFSLLISIYIVYSAYHLGCSQKTIAKMVNNILLDYLLGLLPVIGDILDITFKANTKNMALLEQDLQKQSSPRPAGIKSLYPLILIVLLAIILTIFLIKMFF